VIDALVRPGDIGIERHRDVEPQFAHSAPSLLGGAAPDVATRNLDEQGHDRAVYVVDGAVGVQIVALLVAGDVGCIVSLP
jgi:hypothetical protein